MRGIVSHGTYLPHHRLCRERVATALGTPVVAGSRTVASYDEDSTTLGVEAARLALLGSQQPPAQLLFATSTPAYLDKSNASALHAALGLPAGVVALDTAGALRSGVGALLLALRGGESTLVVCADIRTGRPGSDEELGGGDAGVAFVVGEGDDVVADYLGGASITAELMDRWRLPGETTARSWEEKFGEKAYAGLVDEAVAAALENTGLGADELDVVVVSGIHARAVRQAQGRLRAVVDDVTPVVGHAGTAHAGLLLSRALESAQPNQRLALVSLADGVDVLLFRATQAVGKHRPPSPVVEQLGRGDAGLDYPTFLTWRGFLDRQPPRRPDPVRPAAPPSFRSRAWKFGFTGSVDGETGAVHLPPQRVSQQGGAVDAGTPVRRADTRGTVATFTVDHLAHSLNPPALIAVVDFDEGGRYLAELTDVRPDEVAIGMRVEMTFRRLFTANGVHNYFWKARPVRGAS